MSLTFELKNLEHVLSATTLEASLHKPLLRHRPLRPRPVEMRQG